MGSQGRTRLKRLSSSSSSSSSSVTHSAMSNSFRPHGLYPARLLCPWDSPGKNSGVGWHSLLQRIFLTQGSNPGLLHCRQILYHLSYLALRFCLLGAFQLLIQHPCLLPVCSDFLSLHGSVLVSCRFLGLYPFLPSYLICWHVIVHSVLLQSFIIGISCNVSFYNFINLKHLFFLSLAMTKKNCQFFSKNLTLSLVHLFYCLSSLLFTSALIFTIFFFY